MQILLPLRYYLGDDLFDERFAWRMFSPIRVVRCEASWFEGASRRPLSAARSVHFVWLELMRRARMDVILGFAQRRCKQLAETSDPPELYLDLQCPHPDGLQRPVSSELNLCAHP